MIKSVEPGRISVILGLLDVLLGTVGLVGLDAVGFGVEVVGASLVWVSVLRMGLVVGWRMALMVVEARVRMAVAFGVLDWDAVGIVCLWVSVDLPVGDGASDDDLEFVG